jgi:hypothetical protein
MLRQQTDLNSTALLDRWKVSRFCNNPEKSSYGTRHPGRTLRLPTCFDLGNAFGVNFGRVFSLLWKKKASCPFF